MSNNNEKLVKDIRRRTRKKYSSEEKIRIVLEGMRGEESIAELCRREGLNQNVYYRWSKEFLEAGKQRLAGDIKREASSVSRQKIWDKIAGKLRETFMYYSLVSLIHTVSVFSNMK